MESIEKASSADPVTALSAVTVVTVGLSIAAVLVAAAGVLRPILE